MLNAIQTLSVYPYNFALSWISWCALNMTSQDIKYPSKRSQFNAYNFLVCFLVSLGQIAFGHPASIIGTTLYVSRPLARVLG